MVGIAQLVERQVVALEVEGSNPSSYPISTKNNLETLLQIQLLLRSLNKNLMLSTTFITQQRCINNNLLLKNSALLRKKRSVSNKK